MSIANEHVSSISITAEIFDKLLAFQFPFLVIPVYCYLLRQEKAKDCLKDKQKIAFDLKMGFHDVLYAIMAMETNNLLPIQFS